MAIVAGDLVMYLSANTNTASQTSTPANSIGGTISTTAITDATPNNLFDDVDSTEAGSGDTEYRCIMIKNDTGGGLSLENAKIWQFAESVSAQTTTTIGIGGTIGSNNIPCALPGDESTVPNVFPANTTPVAFVPATSLGTALTLGTGTLAPGDWVGIWIRRIVDADAAALANDNFTLRIQGDTLP